jgi:hypothetical protein
MILVRLNCNHVTSIESVEYYFAGHLTVLGVLSCYTEITCKNNKEQEMNFRSFGFSGTEELCSAC